MEQGRRRVRFKSPPVVEVCLGVQFDLPRPLKVVEIADLWRLFAAQYPETQDLPPLPPVVERFGGEEGLVWEVQVGVEPPTPRCWFLTKDGSELIQVQSGRFLHNWRKTTERSEYPSYHPLAKKFRAELQTFCEFLKSANVGDLRANQCELTYIDHFEAGPPGGHHEDPRRFLTFALAAPTARGVAEADGLQTGLRYVFPSIEKPVGRIHVSAVSGRRRIDGQLLYIMNMTARGAPTGSGLDGVFGYMEQAHRAIYELFLALTNPQRRDEWGPYNVPDVD